MSYDVMKMGYCTTYTEAKDNIDKILNRESFIVLTESVMYTKIGNELVSRGSVKDNFVDVDTFNTDFKLARGYYEIIDATNSKYSIFVNDDLLIPKDSVIKDVAGYVRLQGVKLPCRFQFVDKPTIPNNTEGITLLELSSNFENRGNVNGIKTLIK